MAKLLHTSDWHLGVESWVGSKSTDRTQELRQALYFLVDQARDKQVDLILITGDVLHNRVSPKIEALNLLAEVLSQFASIAPTVLVLGNHDWQGLKAWKSLKVKNLFIIDELVVDPLEMGEYNLFAIPYVDTQRLLEYQDNLSRVQDVIDEAFEEIRRNLNPWKLNILAAHLMVEGSVESERENHVEVQIKTSTIPTGLDYVALGHIHNQSHISENPTVCYAGSPIMLDFGEEGETKGALLVEFNDFGTQITKLRSPYRTLKTFYMPDYSGQSIDQLTSELRSFDGYARVVFDAPESIEIRRYFLENFECVRKVVFKNEVDSLNPLTEFKKLDLLDMYREFIKGRFEGFEKEMVSVVEEILKEVRSREAS